MKEAVFLKRVLIANIIYSVSMSIVVLLFDGMWSWVGELTDGQAASFGVQLLVFALLMMVAIWRKKISSLLMYLIISLDLVYVVATSIRMFSETSLSQTGFLAIAVSVLIVLEFAILQSVGLRRYNRMRAQTNSHHP